MRLFDDARGDLHRLSAGAVHLPDFLDEVTQADLMARCAEWGSARGGWHRPKVRGGEMSVDMVCLGWHWFAYGYSKRTRGNGDHAVQPMPDLLCQVARDVVSAAVDPHAAIGPYGENDFAPDVAIVNRYTASTKMGMHQDRDERCNAPVVSLSLGASAIFRFGNSSTRAKPYTDIELRAGDAFVFWGEDRLAYHGITKVLTTPSAPQRVNITIRQSGLSVAG